MNKSAWRNPCITCLIVFAASLVNSLSAHGKDLVIGQSTALAGVLASSGESMRLGAQVCFDMVNAAGGIIKAIGVKAAHGLAITAVFPSPTRTDFGIVKEYLSALKKFGPKDALPSVVSLEGFIVAKVIVEALRRSGPTPTRAAVIKSLETMSNTDIGGFSVNFGPRVRAGSHYVDITVINKHGVVLR